MKNSSAIGSGRWMQKSMLRGMLLGVLALPAACQKQADTNPAAPEAATQANNGGPTQAMGADAPKPATGGAFITQVTQVRKEPSDVKEVDDASAGKKKKTPNWLATLYRGEQVTVVSNRQDWLQVTTSDEKTGWVKTDSVLLGAGADMATVLGNAKLFTRPDMLALNAAKQIEPGSLLFVQRTKDQFSEVNFGGTATAWVLTDVVTKDAQEVEAAKLLHKARLLKARNDPAADGLLDLAKTHFANTRLVQTLLLAPPVDPNAPVDPAGTDPNAPVYPAGIDPNTAPPSQPQSGDVPPALPNPGVAHD